MEDQTTEREEQRLREVARDYQSRGYEVTLHPPSFSIPGVPPDYRPDMIARRGGENVVVEVRSGHTMSQSPQVTAIAEAVKFQPGWTFELVVTTPAPAEASSGQLEVLSRERTQQLLDAASKLADVGDCEAALVVAWSAVEAAMRHIANREVVSLEGLQTSGVAKQLVAYGLLGRQDLELLNQAMEVRNAVAHGFASRTVSVELVRKVIDLAKSLLAPATSAESQP